MLVPVLDIIQWFSACSCPSNLTPTYPHQLLEEGADIHAIAPKRQAGGSALAEAIAGKHEALVELLLRYGADPFTENPAGKTPLDLALDARAVNIVRACERQALFAGYVSTRVRGLQGWARLGMIAAGAGLLSRRRHSCLHSGGLASLQPGVGCDPHQCSCRPVLIWPLHACVVVCARACPAGGSAQGLQLHPEGPLGGHLPALHAATPWRQRGRGAGDDDAVQECG